MKKFKEKSQILNNPDPQNNLISIKKNSGKISNSKKSISTKNSNSMKNKIQGKISNSKKNQNSMRKKNSGKNLNPIENSE